MLLRLWVISMLAVMTLPATSQEDSCKTVHRIAADVVSFCVGGMMRPGR